MKETYFHSVQITQEACRGCTFCVKHCPTEAIRVRNGKAMILPNRCIDCGTCIRNCPFRAPQAKTDQLSRLKDFQYNIVLPPPSLYSQFNENIHRESIWQGLMQLGFDEIFDVALASDYIAVEIEKFIHAHAGEHKTYISCACPAVLRLIQVKFPELIPLIIPVLPPAEAAAIYIKNKIAREKHLPKEQIGVWFIAPCPSKGANIHQPVDVVHPEITGAFTVSAVYSLIMKNQKYLPAEKFTRPVSKGSSYGMGWGVYGGELKSAGLTNAIAVHGLAEVRDVLEQLSLNKMPGLDYVECSACQSGCVGGPLVSENRFVAETNLKRRIHNMRLREPATREATLKAALKCEGFPQSAAYVKPLQPRPMMSLDADINVAMQKVERMEEILRGLPGLDCGVCGAPSCMCLAEDIVQGRAHEMDCIFKLRAQVKKLAYGMAELSRQLPLTGGNTMDDGLISSAEDKNHET